MCDKYVDMDIWKYVNMDIWKYVNMDIWKECCKICSVYWVVILARNLNICCRQQGK